MMTVTQETPMTYRGHIEKGKVILDSPARLPDGTEVSITPIRRRKATTRSKRKKMPTLYERLKKFAGKAEGLPPDASTNLDHHLYGLPRRK